jgi:hypothetical protein
LAVLAAERSETLLVDLAGESPAVLGLPAGDGPGLVDWLDHHDPPPPDALARLERPVGPALAVLSVDQPPSVRALATTADRLDLLARLLAVETRTVVVDLGRWEPRWAPVLERAHHRVLVTRLCYLALRAASAGPAPSAVVAVVEPGRALGPGDVTAVVDAPVRVRIPVDPAIARVVDAGLLGSRLPRPLRRLAALLPPEP